jgi:amidohydrolase
MRAWMLDESPGEYRVGEVDDPVVGLDDVRVRPVASALNHMDLWLTRGQPRPPRLPHVPGCDVAGVVESVGEQIDQVAVGDEVVLNPSVMPLASVVAHGIDAPAAPGLQIVGEQRWGGHGELVVVPGRNVVARPAGRSWEECAAYPLATLTAWRMLRRARVQAGESVLIVGIGGGVSAAALALARRQGAVVYATSRDAAKRRRAVELGAAAAFDSGEDWPVTVDVVVESVGPATWERSLRALKPGGRMAVCGGTSGPKVELSLPRLFFKQVEIIGSTMGSYEEFGHVTDLVAQGLDIHVDEVVPLDDYPRALARLRAGEQLGKVVLRHPEWTSRTRASVLRMSSGAPATSDTLAAAKARLAHEVARRAELLVDVSHQIHAHPELLYEEHFAHDLLTEVLEGEGLEVTRQARGIATAFEARSGSRGPTVAVMCEYDALPAVGHACGHNVIAASGLGAGLAAAALADELGGRILVLGTPAEEGGGGKVLLADAGALDGVDAAVMVHPADADLSAMDVIAVQEVVATYEGQAAHAAAFPHRGRNALDACVLGYLNVAALRQHITPSERIHGIISHGGDKPNVVPSHARSEWMVRSETLERLVRLKERFVACIEAGAQAAGCEVRLEWRDPAYADMVDNHALVARYRANAEALGRSVGDPNPDRRVVGSTDMGNVSYLVPSIHPMIQVAPIGVPIHTPDFAGHAAGEGGDRAVLDGATALAWTIADVWLDAAVLPAARAEWEQETARRTGSRGS